MINYDEVVAGTGRERGYSCLLFDLDGTLVDSRADLVTSVNLMLAELGERSLSSGEVIGFVGEGARLLVERSLRAAWHRNPDDSETEAALGLFLRHYREHLLDQTSLYPGVGETLDRLRQSGRWPMAIVTNKPYNLTVALLEGLGLRHHFAAVIGGDSLPERKPSPLMLLEASRQCGASASQALMVGDSPVDIAAGRRAGAMTCGYTGGFRRREELTDAGADFLIDHFTELLRVVGEPLFS
ncbi:MAG: phosphoglycolate phosphatase [Blastocatellia bacterium]